MCDTVALCNPRVRRAIPAPAAGPSNRRRRRGTTQAESWKKRRARGG